MEPTMSVAANATSLSPTSGEDGHADGNEIDEKQHIIGVVFGVLIAIVGAVLVAMCLYRYYIKQREIATVDSANLLTNNMRSED